MALAATLVCGSRVWPGIVLGSFLINIWPPFDPTTVLSLLMSIALATSIGVGTALQAQVGACLVRRFVPDAERAAYEEAMRREGYPDFQITELQNSSEPHDSGRETHEDRSPGR